MSKLNLTQAAIEVGKSKPTISKAIKNGRLSAIKVENEYQIDPAELFRVYPKKPQKLAMGKQQSEPSVALLELEVKMLREALDREREIVQDYKEQATRANNLLVDARKPIWSKVFRK